MESKVEPITSGYTLIRSPSHGKLSDPSGAESTIPISVSRSDSRRISRETGDGPTENSVVIFTNAHAEVAQW